MTYYPIFLDLRGRPVLVVGAGKVALRKTLGLVEAEASVTVVAPRWAPEFERLPVPLVRRAFEPADVEGACLVFAATDDREVNRLAGELARAARHPGQHRRRPGGVRASWCLPGYGAATCRSPFRRAARTRAWRCGCARRWKSGWRAGESAHAVWPASRSFRTWRRS